MTLTKEQVIRDREDSARDIKALRQIIAGMEAFISLEAEDRSSLRFDLLKYQAFLTEAERLHGLIEVRLEELSKS